MNLISKKHIPLMIMVLLANNGVVVNASPEESDIKTTDISREIGYVVSNYTAPRTIVEKPDGFDIDMSSVAINSAGVVLEEVLAQPEIVILSSDGVPDGEGVCNSANKTYMPYTAVTSRSSGQYKLLYSPNAYTDPETGLRMYDGRICIAVGTFYASKIGTKINLVMENGSVVECILGDVKADCHTDPTNRYQAVDGSVVEMIVDYAYFHSTSQYPASLRGRVKSIQVVE